MFFPNLNRAHPGEPKLIPHPGTRQNSGKTVLLAEDDDDLRCVMELTLGSMGYRVIASADAEIASSAFRSHNGIDILLTDFDMPGRSGVELARELTILSPSLPVMIITASLLSTATLQEIHDRHWTYVSKPCHLGALGASLKQVLSTSSRQAA